MPEILMPKLSDTMTEGTLVSWKKKIGDKVSSGEVLAEIETDKATMEWEATDDGILKEIYVQEGGKVNVGDRIAFIAGDSEEAPGADKGADAENPETKEIEEGDEYPAEEEEDRRRRRNRSLGSSRPNKKQRRKAPNPRKNRNQFASKSHLWRVRSRPKKEST